MKKIVITALGIFISGLLAAQTYTGTYELEMKFANPPMNYEYTNCRIVITDKSATIVFDNKMTPTGNKANNYVRESGSGDGSLNGDNFTGNGFIVFEAFENGERDTYKKSNFTMQGKAGRNSDLNQIEGNFTIMDGGNSIIGTFKAKQTSVILVKLIRGKCSLLKNKENEWSELSIGNPYSVTVNDKIKTEDNTRVEMSFNDGSTFRVKSNTILTLMNGGIQLQVGESWFNLQKQGTSFQVVTPTAVFGVMGTEFTVTVLDSGHTFANLLRGKIWVTDKNIKKIIMEPGQSLKVPSSGMGNVEKIDTADVRKQFESSDNPVLGNSGSWFSNKLFLYGGGGLLGVIIIVLILVFALRKPKHKKNVPVMQNYQAKPSPNFQQNQQVQYSVMQPPLVINQPPAKPVQSNLTFCPACGVKLKPNAKFCHSCTMKL